MAIIIMGTFDKQPTYCHHNFYSLKDLVIGGVTHGNKGIQLVDVSKFGIAVEQQSCVVCICYSLLVQSLRQTVNFSTSLPSLILPSGSPSGCGYVEHPGTVGIDCHGNSCQWQPQFYLADDIRRFQFTDGQNVLLNGTVKISFTVCFTVY